MADDRISITEKGALVIELMRAIAQRTKLDENTCFGIIEEHIDEIYNAIERVRLRQDLGITGA